MPATKNAMTRYALIDKMLSNHNRAYSIQDITNVLAKQLPEFGLDAVSKRCVEKDLNYLEFDSPFDVEIEDYWIDATDKNDRPYKKRCIRYSDPTFSIFKPKITEDEKTVLSAALDTLGSFEGLDNFEWLDNLKSKLNLREHKPAISLSKNLLNNSTLLARLFTTIRLGQAIDLQYYTFNSETSGRVTVSPYLLKEYNNRWFLIAGACDSGKVLTFPLDRINDFCVVYINNYRPVPDDLQERYEEIIGVTYKEENPLQEIVFWISDKSKDYIITKPMHGSQKTIRGTTELSLRSTYPHLKNGGFFQIECRENYELLRELTSYGPELIVLSPTNIAEKIYNQLQSMLENYSYQNICLEQYS